MSEWIDVVDVGYFRLWQDTPAATSLTLACTVAELEASIDALELPVGKPVEYKKYHRLRAEVRTRDDVNVVRPLAVYLTTVVPVSAPGRLHTDNGAGDWVAVGDSLRLVGFDAD